MPRLVYLCVLCQRTVTEDTQHKVRQIKRGVCLPCSKIAMTRFLGACDVLTFDEWWELWHREAPKDALSVVQKTPKEVARVAWTAALVHGISNARSTDALLRQQINLLRTGTAHGKDAHTSVQQNSGRKQNAQSFETCGDCDGCGWVEGGKALQTKCATCKGTGLVPVTL